VERVCALQSVIASSKGPNFRIPLNRDTVIVSEDATNHFSSPDLNPTATPIRKSDRIRAILSDAVSSIDIIGLYPLKTYFEVYNYRTEY
jgi:hypothetical protein